MSKTRWLIVIPLGIIIAGLLIAFTIISHKEELPTNFVDCLNHKYAQVTSNDKEIICQFKVIARQNQELFDLCKNEGGGTLGTDQNAFCTITYYEKSPTCYKIFCN